MAQFRHLQRPSLGVDNAIAVANINAFSQEKPVVGLNMVQCT